MSDIALNAMRYDTKNTKRSDPPNTHNGGLVGNNVIGFDCSGFVCHVMVESGYSIDYESTSTLSKSIAFFTISVRNVTPGDIILFSGHVGIVIEYDHNTGLGRFIHMSGKNNIGSMQKSYFVTNDDNYRQASGQNSNLPLKGPDGEVIRHGILVPIKLFRRVNSNRYSQELDLHINGSNPYPVLKPLGVSVYSNHRLRKEKLETKVVEKRKSLPTPNPLRLKDIPDWMGKKTVLLKKAWGKLTEGSLEDYE